MTKGRLEAFSDGVIAILITIMVLEFHVPPETTWSALVPLIPSFLSYLLSFTMVGIYWNNHHHLLHSAKSIDGSILWANLHLLFWLSLVPFVTAWVGEHEFAAVPVIMQGVVMLGAGAAYGILTWRLVRHHGPGSEFVTTLGRTWKEILSVILYATGIGLTFVHPWLGFGTYVLIAALWFVPDRRFERSPHA